MWTRRISVLTAAFCLAFIGCYQVSRVPMKEFVDEQYPASATFHTHDSRTYSAKKDHYSLSGKTLVMREAELVSDTARIPYRGLIPVSGVDSVDVETFDASRTIVVVGSAGLAGVFAWSVDKMMNLRVDIDPLWAAVNLLSGTIK